jgi:hypothetical protein
LPSLSLVAKRSNPKRSEAAPNADSGIKRIRAMGSLPRAWIIPQGLSLGRKSIPAPVLFASPQGCTPWNTVGKGSGIFRPRDASLRDAKSSARNDGRERNNAAAINAKSINRD